MVIGSNCFTGSHIVDAILESPDSKVIGVSRSAEYKDFFLPYKRHGSERFAFRQVNIVREFDILCNLIKEQEPEIIINVAALSEVVLSNHQPIEYFETNTMGTVKLGNFLRKCPFLERYIHISSAEVFGSCSNPVTEDHRFDPSTPYAVSKAAADMYLATISNNFAFPATLIRSTNVYGRYQQLYKIIPRTVIYLKLGKPIRLHGGGKAVKSFIHVRDVVRGLLLSLERGGPGTYHFTVPSELTIADIVQMICEAMNRDFNTAAQIEDERLGQDTRYWLDCSKTKRDLGWEPQIRFDQGIFEVIDWVESNWTAVQQETLEYVHKP